MSKHRCVYTLNHSSRLVSRCNGAIQIEGVMSLVTQCLRSCFSNQIEIWNNKERIRNCVILSCRSWQQPWRSSEVQRNITRTQKLIKVTHYTWLMMNSVVRSSQKDHTQKDCWPHMTTRHILPFANSWAATSNTASTAIIKIIIVMIIITLYCILKTTKSRWPVLMKNVISISISKMLSSKLSLFQSALVKHYAYLK